jgi:hypothetical protein
LFCFYLQCYLFLIDTNSFVHWLHTKSLYSSWPYIWKHKYWHFSKKLLTFFQRILGRYMTQMFSFIKLCILSTGALRQHMLDRNYSVDMRRNKSETQKKTKMGSWFNILTFQYQSKNKNNFWTKRGQLLFPLTVATWNISTYFWRLSFF